MKIKSFICSLLMANAFASHSVNAEVVYSYTGNNYTLLYPSGTSIYNETMSITGSFTVSSPLINFNGDLSSVVTSYTFNDGIHTISNINGFIQNFVMSTDSVGNPVLWDIIVSNKDGGDPSLALGDQITNIRTRQSLSSFEDTPQVYECTFKIGSSCSFDLFSDASSLTTGNWSVVTTPVDLSGTIKTTEGTDICAMVLASGQYMFSCNPVGVFSLEDLPQESDGTVKRQIYADGFFPKIDSLPDSTTEDVVLTRSGVCPDYNVPYEPAFMPGSAGKEIYIAGEILLQNSETPICAMVLANGQYVFSCDGTGSYFMKIPLDSNGQFKLQVYADGFAPSIRRFDEFKTTNIVRMARAVECQ